MLSRFYLYAWILLAATAIGSILTGSVTGLGTVAYALITLGLVYAFVLWTVIVNVQRQEASLPATGYAGGA